MTQKSLRKFNKGLKSAIKQTCNHSGCLPSELRPFVSDGDLFESKVFIVGVNPASNVTWKSFWNPETGSFKKSSWIESYEKERIRIKIQQGKKKILKRSPTRRKIDLLVEEFLPYKCMETNIYSKATHNKGALKKEDQSTYIFDFLLNSIKPKALYLFGEEPYQYFNGRYNLSKQYEVVKIKLEYGEAIAFSTCHLSRRQPPVTHIDVIGWARLLKSQM